ncbi:MAG: hypothetical protein PWP06_1730 [Candidatus Marinimicrobia bacterium]|nr:hypothetical protein [Candidatus Neomarinimicrobiota bacterium]
MYQWFFLIFSLMMLGGSLMGQSVDGLLPGFSLSPAFNEQVSTFSYTSDIRVHINAACPDSFDTDKPVGLALYALPNGNTIEQTVGKQLVAGDDWHYDIQHIGAQTRFLRQRISDYNLVVVYLETSQKSWPAWKSEHPDHQEIVENLVNYLKSCFKSMDPFIILTGHSGGGRFTFSYLDAVTEIPDDVKRILFLDSNYGYEHTYGDQMIQWLNAAPDHYLTVIAYNDSVALYNGEPIVSPTGGTWYRSRIMQRYMADSFSFTTSENEDFIRHSALDGRLRFILKKNPEQAILHTVQVEKNGFIHGMLTGTAEENQGYEYYGDRAYDDEIQADVYHVTDLQIPLRSEDAQTGSEFMQSVLNLSFEDREQAIWDEISTGNIPNFLRELKRVEATFTDANSLSHTVSYQVMPDYLAIGSDEDFCRIPMGPITAQKIADRFGGSMPTRKLVDHIYVHAEVKLEPVTYPWSEESVKVSRFIEHHEDIEALRLAAGGELGQLMGGLKKDVVISNLITDPARPDHVVIYGWHKLDGTPWQPLYNGHFASYVDYSHGIRLLYGNVMIDDEEKDLRTILRDPVLYKILSDETGPMVQPTYIAEASLPPKPKSWGVSTDSNGSIKITVTPDPSVDSYRLFSSPDGLTFQSAATFVSSEYILDTGGRDTLLFFKLQAENSAGLSGETEVLAVHSIPGFEPDILLVYGFDRASTGNTYDFIRYHAHPVKELGLPFVSATNEAVTGELIHLGEYTVVDYILGDESTVDETFSSNEQTKVKSFLQEGGRLFVSGAEIAWDLDYKGSSTDKDFFRNFFKAQYTADAPGNVSGTHYSAEGIEGGLFNGINDITFDNGIHGTLNVKWADAVTGVNGGRNILRYKNVSTHMIGGVSFEGLFPGGSVPGKIVYIGFPFETVYPAETREILMDKILTFLQEDPSAVKDAKTGLPTNFFLAQNYPNPFNPVTTIHYGLPSEQIVRLQIFDINGKPVKTLTHESQPAGYYTVQWDGHSQSGHPVSSGLYICHLKTGNFSSSKKMMFVK